MLSTASCQRYVIDSLLADDAPGVSGDSAGYAALSLHVKGCALRRVPEHLFPDHFYAAQVRLDEIMLFVENEHVASRIQVDTFDHFTTFCETAVITFPDE